MSLFESLSSWKVTIGFVLILVSQIMVAASAFGLGKHDHERDTWMYKVSAACLGIGLVLLVVGLPLWSYVDKPKWDTLQWQSTKLPAAAAAANGSNVGPKGDTAIAKYLLDRAQQGNATASSILAQAMAGAAGATASAPGL